MQRNRYLLRTSLKGLAVGVGLGATLFVTSCNNGDVVLPTFMSEDYKQTDIINNDKIVEIIYLYSQGKINTLSFQMGVHDYEESFYYQMNHIAVDVSFFLEAEQMLKDIYEPAKNFKENQKDEVSYLKNTLLRLCVYMLESMSLSDVSSILSTYYETLDVKSKDFLFDYSLSVVETLIVCLEKVKDTKVTIEDMKVIKSNISKTGSPFKRSEIKIGLRSSFSRLERVTFTIDERMTIIEVMLRNIKQGRNVFLTDDSSFDLLTAIRELKALPWLNEIDYPYVMGNGYVDEMPSGAYNVRQYGLHTDKVYEISPVEIKYRNKGGFWITGSYELLNSTMKITRRYVDEVEVFKVNSNTYLLGSEILLKEE